MDEMMQRLVDTLNKRIINPEKDYYLLLQELNNIGLFFKENMEKAFDKGGDWRMACKNLSDGKISKIEWSEDYEDFEEFYDIWLRNEKAVIDTFLKDNNGANVIR